MPIDPGLGGNYAIGLTNPPPTLESQGIHDPFPTELLPFTELGETTGAGRQIRLGLPKCTWNWGMLTQAQFGYITNLVSGGDAQVFIKTRIPSGTLMTYTTFQAIMHYPSKSTSVAGGLWKDIEVVFTQLVNA